ncbi:MAG TPA: YegS/Rv2252/BmrU family lipid kinase [Thermomicrobiales bacterium]|nr:YegS/Rv2252/BmrU family lipid kinase [Thermomicrobiales bacterium]
MTVRVILNPNAGTKIGIASPRVTAGDLRELLARRGLSAEIVEAPSADRARELTRDAVARGCRAVVAAGGDGTVGLVAGELIGTTTALGILPLGSVMNVARMLDIPRDLDAAAAVLAAGRARAIDVGRANGQLFFECGSVGMIAPVFREIQRMEDERVAGALSAVRTVLRYRPARMIMHLDDRVLTTRSLLVTVANGPYTGIGLTVAPDARVDDGLFDVRVFRRFGRFGLAFYLMSIAAGRTRYTPRIDAYRSSTVRIESRSPLPARADGSDLGSTPVTFSLLPRALKVIAP